MWLSNVSQFVPGVFSPVYFLKVVYRTTLSCRPNLIPHPSMLMLVDCKAGVTVSSYLDVFLYLSASPRVSHCGYWRASPDSFLWSFFTCPPVWLSMASGIRRSRCLSSLVCFHLFPALASALSQGCLGLSRVFPTLASGVRLSGCLLFSLGSHSYVSRHGFITVSILIQGSFFFLFIHFLYSFPPESVWAKGSSNSGGLSIIFIYSHFHTYTHHPFIFTPAHLHIYSSSHLNTSS